MKHKFRTTNIKGKEYVMVADKLAFFRNNEQYNGWSIETEFVDLTPDHCTIKAFVKDQNGRTIATGHAHEIQASSMINKTSYVENCETSAIGRALTICGIAIEDFSIASAEDVTNAIAKQELIQANETYQSLLAKLDPETARQFSNVTGFTLERYQKGIAYLTNLIDLQSKIK
jgi:hypothetical protein